MSLQIIKYGNKNFQHKDPNYQDYGANDITVIFEGDTVRIRSLSGRVVFNRVGYNYTDITIIDESNGGTPETFPNIISLKQRLINLGYPFQGGLTDVVLDIVEWGSITGSIETQGDLVTYISENSVQTITGGDHIDIDDTDPNNIIVSFDNVINGGTP